MEAEITAVSVPTPDENPECLTTQEPIPLRLRFSRSETDETRENRLGRC